MSSTVHLQNDLLITALLSYIMYVGWKYKSRVVAIFVTTSFMISGLDGAAKIIFGTPTLAEALYQLVWIAAAIPATILLYGFMQDWWRENIKGVRP